MESSHQKELLLCALKHFDIEIVNAAGRKVILRENTYISMADGPQFHLWEDGRREATFTDVVRLCTYIKTQLGWNEKKRVENSGTGE
ncbi:MAG: hypothetical protein H6560_24075 [Lewinellaceae bacterium]|nr:hypothetical protein [Lewinellaceae bacterium]